MSEAWVFLTAVIASAGTVVATLVRSRRSGPDHQAQLVAQGMLMVEQMQLRIDRLEQRIAHLEKVVDDYYRLHGPLPVHPDI